MDNCKGHVFFIILKKTHRCIVNGLFLLSELPHSNPDAPGGAQGWYLQKLDSAFHDLPEPKQLQNERREQEITNTQTSQSSQLWLSTQPGEQNWALLPCFSIWSAGQHICGMFTRCLLRLPALTSTHSFKRCYSYPFFLESASLINQLGWCVWTRRISLSMPSGVLPMVKWFAQRLLHLLHSYHLCVLLDQRTTWPKIDHSTTMASCWNGCTFGTLTHKIRDQVGHCLPYSLLYNAFVFSLLFITVTLEHPAT